MNKIPSKDLKGTAYVSACSVESQEIERTSTGDEELNWLYGATDHYFYHDWGMPEKSISLWSGESGTGKSRVAVEVAKILVEKGKRVLYFQAELPLENFVGKIGVTDAHQNLLLSEERTLSGIVDAVYDASPQVVVIDSVNQISEFKKRNGADVLIDGNETQIGFRQMCNEKNVILILLAQVNQDETKIKGGSTLPHLVDVHFNFEKDPKGFVIKSGIKNRFGPLGKTSLWVHTNEGCKSISDNRLKNKEWCESHGIEESVLFTFVDSQQDFISPDGKKVTMVVNDVEKEFSIKDIQAAIKSSSKRVQESSSENSSYWSQFWREFFKI